MNSSKIAIACRAIGNGFLSLADAIAEPDVASSHPVEQAKGGRKKAGSEISGDPVDDLPDEPLPEEGKDKAPADDPVTDPELKEIALEDLQDLGGALLKSAKRDHFIRILAEHNIKNLSAASPENYRAIYDDLKKAGE